MTIAVCAVTPEGVVLGADSTLTLTVDGAQQYLNNEQKIFEVGQNGSLGVLTWGLGRIGGTSHRSRVATLAKSLQATPPADLAEVAQRFADQLWTAYNQAHAAEIGALKQVIIGGTASPEEIEKAKGALAGASLGFCVAGCLEPGGTPGAFELAINADLTGPPVPTPVNEFGTWGSNIFIFRALGLEFSAMKPIMDSGKWTGTQAELEALILTKRTPLHTMLPLREAIDVVHTFLHMTVKFLKFTALPPNSGGPIEIAAITTDRAFRWVRHKNLDAAIHAS